MFVFWLLPSLLPDYLLVLLLAADFCSLVLLFVAGVCGESLVWSTLQLWLLLAAAAASASGWWWCFCFRCGSLFVFIVATIADIVINLLLLLLPPTPRQVCGRSC